MTCRIAFMGTPDFAVPSLSELLANGFEVACVYTQPPRPSGRGQKLTKSPVHQFAEIMGLPVRTPQRFLRSRVIDEFQALEVDVACVVAYGQILPIRALEAPRYGCLNLHASLLPRWRGAAPVQRAVMAGDKQTGVQIMQMARGLDTGDILLSETVPIADTDTAATLSTRLSHIGAGLWPRALAAMERGCLTPSVQSGEVTYAHKIEKSEARIDWSRSAQELDCHIRGLSPFPGAWCEINGKRVKIHMAHIEAASGQAGQVLDGSLLIACGDGALRVTELQAAGKSKMQAEEYLRGHDLPQGTRLT